MFPIVEPRQRPERFLLNRFSPLAESAAFLGLGGFDAAGSVWYPDARRLLGGVPNDGTLTNMDPATDWVWSPELGRWINAFGGDAATQYISTPTIASAALPCSIHFWLRVPTLGAAEGLFDTSLSTTKNYGLFASANATGTLSFTVGTGGDIGPGARKTFTTTNTIAAGVWYSVLFEAIASGDQHIHVNGVEWSGAYSGSGTTYATDSSGSAIGAYFSATNDYGALDIGDYACWHRAMASREREILADPSNVMLEVGGVPLILPPQRVSFPAAVAEPSGFKPYWARPSYQIIGGGIA